MNISYSCCPKDGLPGNQNGHILEKKQLYFAGSEDFESYQGSCEKKTKERPPVNFASYPIKNYENIDFQVFRCFFCNKLEKV